MLSRWMLVLLVPLAAGCNGHKADTISIAPAHNPVTSTASGSSAPPTCGTSDLSVRMGASGGAAGSEYAPVVFTNTSAVACTLAGYPGVSYAAPNDGAQVGAAASRNALHAAMTVTLAPGATASALVQMANHANYPAATCKTATVGGLRVYPPGSRTAGYVAFGS